MFNCCTELSPTAFKPLCLNCGRCYYYRDYFSPLYYNIHKDYNQKQKHKEKQPLPLAHNKRNLRADLYKNILTWPTYTAISNCSDTIIVIDESVRRKLGKIHFLELILQITSKQMNWRVDIIPTGTSDNDIIKVFNSYVNIPAIILTSDKDLHRKLLGHSILVKTKKGRNAVRIIIESLKHRISRL